MRRLIICQLFLLFLFLGCKCKIAGDPTARPYNTLEESKSNDAFVAELKPQQPFIEIEGHKFYITAAWIEHPHNETNFGDVVGNKIYCFVMELEYNPSFNIDLSEYIQELGNGPTSVWLFLTKGLEKMILLNCIIVLN